LQRAIANRQNSRKMRRNSFLPFLLSCILIFAACLVASAQSLESRQKRRDQLEKDIEILRKQISTSTTKSEEALSSLTLIKAEASSRRRLVAESDKQIGSLNGQIRSTQKELRTQQAVLDTLKAQYTRLVMGAYKNRDVKIWYMYILASDNISQAFRRFGYFKSLSSQINAQARSIEQVQQDLEQKKDKLLSLKGEAQQERKVRANELSKIKQNEAAQQKIVANLKKNKAAYTKSLQKKQREMKELDRQIARMIQEAAGTGAKKKPVDYTLSDNFASNCGKLPWPVDGPVAEHYGAYQNKELKLSLFNNGINIACEPKSKICAVFDGVVSNVMIAPGYGQCILIQHGEYYTSYCKVKTALVHQGDKVKTGQVIGEVATIMGKTQLYFLIWKKEYLDPEIWLRDR